jgi:hypothetical protein
MRGLAVVVVFGEVMFGAGRGIRQRRCDLGEQSGQWLPFTVEA